MDSSLIDNRPKGSCSPQDGKDGVIADLVMESLRIRRLVNTEDSPIAANCAELHLLLQDHLQRLEELFATHYIELREHTGDQWIDGLPLTVVHAREGIREAVVVETIRPSIVLRDRIIAHGYVVIGDRSELEQTR